MRLAWPDLVIEHISPDDFGAWILEWAGLIEGRIAPAFMNKFGVWFLRRAEGPVEMLDVFSGTVERVAESYEEFVCNVNDPSWQEAYLLSPLVFTLHEAGKIPGDYQCYAVALHPVMGGPNPMAGELVEPRFVTVMDIPVWQSLCAQFVGRGRA
ncbi:MAG: hypothetical protein EXR98_23980 [Gemmataceae bacterium]|nr:hypothetical protein [Gemmataceae bacterium]